MKFRYIILYQFHDKRSFPYFCIAVTFTLARVGETWTQDVERMAPKRKAKDQTSSEKVKKAKRDDEFTPESSSLQGKGVNSKTLSPAIPKDQEAIWATVGSPEARDQARRAKKDVSNPTAPVVVKRIPPLKPPKPHKSVTPGVNRSKTATLYMPKEKSTSGASGSGNYGDSNVRKKSSDIIDSDSASPSLKKVWVILLMMVVFLACKGVELGRTATMDSQKNGEDVKGLFSRHIFSRSSGISATASKVPNKETASGAGAAAARERKEKEREDESRAKERELKEKKEREIREKNQREKEREKEAAAAKAKAAKEKLEAAERKKKEKEKEKEEKRQAALKVAEEEARRKEQQVKKDAEEEERRKRRMRELHEAGIAKEQERVRQAKAAAEAKAKEDKMQKDRELELAKKATAELALRLGDEAAAKQRKIEERLELEVGKASNNMLTVGRGDYTAQEHDVAGLWRGARVVTTGAVVSGVPLTSPWLHHSKSLLKKAIAWTQRVAPPVNKLYNPSRPPTDFFSFKGSQGTITVVFQTHAYVREMKLYHPLHDAQRAPKDIRLLGWTADPTQRKHRKHEPIVLGHYRYVPGKRDVQAFPIMKQKLKTALAAVTVDVTSNYYHDHHQNGEDCVDGRDSKNEDNYTNIWRLMVIGDEVNEVQIV